RDRSHRRHQIHAASRVASRTSMSASPIAIRWGSFFEGSERGRLLLRLGGSRLRALLNHLLLLRGIFEARLDRVIGEIRFRTDRKSTRLNSSHVAISYAVFCLK